MQQLRRILPDLKEFRVSSRLHGIDISMTLKSFFFVPSDDWLFR
ncbi:hypothetical protein [Nostoc sp.]